MTVVDVDWDDKAAIDAALTGGGPDHPVRGLFRQRMNHWLDAIRDAALAAVLSDAAAPMVALPHAESYLDRIAQAAAIDWLTGDGLTLPEKAANDA